MNHRPYVICADDDRDILSLVALRLERSGFDVATANDGEEALALARARRPVVVVLDVMMPRLDGVELVKTLRADADLGDVKIILLSARAQDTDVARGLAVGADAYLVKPFKYTELAEEIERLTR
ncbi:MAG TPA: response regulator [Gaiellaceae bacterium]|nr:response regulator [Gaiellaceae bacterium]